MANVNLIETLAVSAVQASSAKAQNPSEHENKSCSGSSVPHLNLMSFLGKRICITQRLDLALHSDKVIARVMAVQIPAQGTDIESGFLLLEDNSPDDGLEYVAVDQLHFFALT